MKTVHLPADYALVLQQIEENGEDDFVNLAESLRIERSRMSHILESLQHKGLIRISRAAHGTWIRLSTRGRRLAQTLWPESGPQAAFSM